MYRVSNILSKQVINLYDGKFEGTIKNICLKENLKQIKWFILFDEDGEEFMLDPNKIYKVGQAITIKNNDGIFNTSNIYNMENNNPINLMCYSVNGEIIGKVSDVELSKNFYIENFYIDENKITTNQIVKISKNLIIVNTEKTKVSLSTFKPKIPIINDQDTNIVEIQPMDIQPQIEKEIPQEIQEEKTLQTPTRKTFVVDKNINQQRIITNQNVLLGRKATKTVYGINNEIIIRKDCIINSKTLEYAKLHNKTTELTLFSKVK